MHIQGDGPVTIQLESPPTVRGTNNKNKTTAQAEPQNSESQASGDSNSSARNNYCVFKSRKSIVKIKSVTVETDVVL